jgi:hypothetical protein
MADFFRPGLVVDDFGVDAHVGFVRHFVAEGLEAIEILDSTAVFAFGLGAVAERQANSVRFLRDPAEPFGYAVVPVLLAGDFDIAIADHVRVHGMRGLLVRSTTSLKALVNMPASSRAPRNIICCERAMRSTAMSSWQLTGL